MKKLQILGTGCPACNKLAELTLQAADALCMDYEFEKVSDINRILDFDVPAVPALVVDGEIRASGRVPTLDELKQLII